MLSAARQTTVILNDEYLAHKDTMESIQHRLGKDIELLSLDPIDYQDTLEYIGDRVTVFRFLKDVDFSEDRAIERLIDTIMWRIENNINRITYQSVAPEFFQNAFSFFHKHDLLGRPVAIVQMRYFPQFSDKTKSLSDFMQPFVCLIMEIARQLTRDNTRKNENNANNNTFTLISQITVIIDIAKAPFVPIDSNLMQTLKSITNTRFPGCIGSVYIMNFGWMYQGLWQVAKLLLSEHAKSRISFTSSKEMDQVIPTDDLLRDLGGTDMYEWSIENDIILQTYASMNRFPPIPLTPPRRRSSISSISSTSSSLFFDASDSLTHQHYHDTIRSTFTSASPSVYGTPGSLTPIESHRRHQLIRTSEPRYFLTGFHMGDAFMTSIFQNNSRQLSLNKGIDGDALSSRLNQLIDASDLFNAEYIDPFEPFHDEFNSEHIFMNHLPLAHFPHLLPDTHPQSIWVTSPVKHHLLRAEQKIVRVTRRLFRLSFAYKGAIYWVMLYIFLRGPVEHTFKRMLAKILAGTSEQITYATIGVTATVASVLSTSFSYSLQNNDDMKHNKKQEGEGMDLLIDIVACCRIRVLIVPVTPIKRSTFLHYVDLIKSFSIIRLGDVTPNLKAGTNAIFNSQLFQDGQLHFDFMTHWSGEHSQYEEYQPYRRLYGVIGIMDCQEWKSKHLSDGYSAFITELEKYPSAVASRCYAFDPIEHQEDNTQGMIMIPNVGNMAFYMSTMICDFASEILGQFSVLANQIKRMDIVESPVSSRSHVPSRSQHRYSQPPPSSSRSFELSRSTSLHTSDSPHTSSIVQNNSSTGDIIRTKKRSLGRIKKMLADYYLLAGRLPDALTHYEEAIEMLKVTSDFLWLASAKEGYLCTVILLEHLQSEIGHALARTPVIFTDDLVTDESNPSSEPRVPRTASILLIDYYKVLIHNYTMVSTTSAFPTPDIIFSEACLRISRFMVAIYSCKGWNHDAVDLLMQGKMMSETYMNELKQRFTNRQFGQQKKGITYRHEIVQYVNRSWKIEMNDISLLDNIYITTNMSTLYSSVGCHRKASWALHESIKNMTPLLIQYRRSGLSKKSTLGHHFLSNGSDVPELLRYICVVYGIGEKEVNDGGILDAMKQSNQSSTKGTNLNKDKIMAESQSSVYQFGWPDLQIEVLKQCISVSEILSDNQSRLYYTTVLLKNFYHCLPHHEQIKLATSIQGMVANSAHIKEVQSHIDSINYWGVNIIASIELVKAIPRKAVYAYPINAETGLLDKIKKTRDPADPFIYNPFSQKKDMKCQELVVENELCEFRITLANPFGFDLHLQNIILSTSGIRFHAVSTTAIIPANTTVTILLTGTPYGSGILTIRGCFIQILGFAEQEFLVNKQEKDDYASHIPKARIKHHGMNAIKYSRNKADKVHTVKFYELTVIPDQPLLKIKSTSAMHGAVMLFEGERVSIHIELENISKIPVDFIALSFSDSTSEQFPQINPEISAEERYEIELYTKGTPVFAWEEAYDTASHASIGRRIFISPGDRHSLKVNVYGKRNCQRGSIQIDYGYLNRTQNTNSSAVFYTRQIYLNLLITVYRNLESYNWDVLYLGHVVPVNEIAFKKALKNIRNTSYSSTLNGRPIEDLLLITRNINIEDKEIDEYCLITVDIRNIWTTPIDILFKIDQSLLKDKNSVEYPIEVCITVLPLSTARVTLPFRRLFLGLDQCNKPIPSFELNKQFVLSQAPSVPEEQRQLLLQKFWYREELLRCVHAKWVCKSTGRSGILNLRSSLRLSFLQLTILKKGNIEFLVEMKGKTVRKLGHKKFICTCNEYSIITISILNRFIYPVKVMLRVQPVQNYNDRIKEYDLSNKLLVEGLHQIVLPEIPANGVVSHSIPLYFLSEGQFEILYHAEDIHRNQIYYDHESAIIEATRK
ncbi:transport protein Trs120 or TRAPPC9 TRAPP II complex subunit-domain-containing protein [Pilobolus umbonatus]|nr:transport protein Trs120 or TRAPPC9 TRAPP II complex subunit-domain-containing protein [Pilobolus umbonatus]